MSPQSLPTLIGMVQPSYGHSQESHAYSLMQSRQKVWPQLGRVCGKVKVVEHRGQRRVPYREVRVVAMEAVVLDGAGRAIPVRVVLLLLGCWSEEAAEAPRPEGGMINAKSIYLSRNAEGHAPW